MPQFAFAENFLPQFVWLAIFFSILYFGIVRLTLPKVGRVMEARERTVTGDIAAAEQAKAASDEMAVRYAADLDAAHKQARASILDAQGKAQASVQAALAQATTELAERQAKADAELAAARSSALAEIEHVASDAAADIVERLTGKRPASGVLTTAARSVVGA